MKNFNILVVHWKIRLLRWGFTKKQYRWGRLPKRVGGLGLYADLRGGPWKGREVETPMHTMWRAKEIASEMK